jgi:Amt family ammonium transporter
MGFNGGSAYIANGKLFLYFNFKGIAALAIVNTNISAASSILIWIILDMINGKLRDQNGIFVSIPGICSATVVGLVVITPAAGYVQPGYTILMGLIRGFIIHLFLTGKKHFFHIDNTLDLFSCHGLGGLIGTFLTGLFCQIDVNNNGRNGAFYGNPIQLGYQIIGILITIAYSAVCTAAILLPMYFTIGIRINRLDQVHGLDNVAHGVIDLDQTQKDPPMKLTAMRPKITETNLAEKRQSV